MQLVEGNLWDALGRAHLLLVSANATVASAGHLVMGRGAAREAKLRFPGLDRELGSLLRRHRMAGSLYGILLATSQWHPYTRLGAFQARRHWYHDADPWLIRYSVRRLRELIDAGPEGQWVAMDYPGIGNGHLREEVVAPILAELPDNVLVYRRPM